ncbi:uncharacterized protein LOC122505205 [Leptopilina heterotoma]|uniref:uncharacterized protein LOC122505205 n=1 Tax=Leptopilina heterotoma TaxID=63436 RepID=UPI001CA82B04|nr:uncharacterized protein LOC122505205 [Leptopilina heterotoma]
MKILNSIKWFLFANIIIHSIVCVVDSFMLPDSDLDLDLPPRQHFNKKLLKNQEEENLPQFALDDPELFHNLTHKQKFFKNCSNLPERMENLYNSSKLLTLDSKTFHEVLNKAFIIWRESNASTYMKFEDLFAILYYTGNGYKEMENNSDESRRMKNAIYRLAITQSLNSEEYETKLYRGEAMPLN